MSPLNYVWYQYRWQRLAVATFEADGERGLVRFLDGFVANESIDAGEFTAESLVALLRTGVSQTLGQAIGDWR